MKWELPCINNVMVAHPFKRVPADICPREEIAAPSKLLALAQVTQDGWDAYDIEGIEYQRTWIQMRVKYPSLSSKIRALGFYGITRHVEMFSSLLDKDTDIFTWLKEYALKPCIITTPLLTYRTKYQEVFYTVSNTFPQETVQIAPIPDLTDQMLAANAYTICNGLTFALAMHRLGHWDHPTFLLALQQWLDATDPLYSEITVELQPLVVQHVIPQTCDHPYFYACMGKDKASIPVLACLREKYGVLEPFHQQHNNGISIVTNASLQMLPYTPLHVFDHVNSYYYEEDDDDGPTTRMDLGGLLQALFTQKGLWKRWMMTYEENLRTYDSFGNDDDFIDRCMKRIFMLYNKGSHVRKLCTSRMRQFWLQIMHVLDPNKVRMTRWVHKYVVLTYIKEELEKQGVHGVFWLPQIPIPFMVDMLAIYKDAWKLFDACTPISIITSYGNLRDIFPEATVDVNESSSKPYRICKVQRPLMSYMTKMPKSSSLYKFAKMMKKKAQEKLRTLYTGLMRPSIPKLNPHDGYTLWMILNDYFTEHKESLCG